MSRHFRFRELGANEAIPYDLLLAADPSRELVEEYLGASAVYVAEYERQVVGVVVLSEISDTQAEIKNISVEESMQGQGIGKFLLSETCRVAKEKQYKSICIGTANSSIMQLYLYQKKGFEISSIRQHFFTDNYPEPIYENGIQAKHMIMLEMEL
ncbi:aminoglycoside 6'-N-acetyltransferase I [Chitinophaga terrae (ex Kim and Jung 2007)]|uniref:Aminoglycoside 6'-N-acetyltransferase I n=1 Tax=Chitinophaga terrae (ex Kim and Jung 2007) TaxID=408074 RepID=A0A1H4FQ71_9BACT|nr:GNAT family N-acetyltransferase [Chitinophaga terrae (ex Kim and Jung 2007)]GEP92614.1 N-acetyltransferase [Chitinophaga terrae (ex Kim and Jung 2007)]SEA98970.1 aminoglycoside 6'-N-acetyltransferase I [Chitinophaga terrae (ex Kim and Jung 2007)]